MCFVVFIALLLSALDLGQMLFFHQALVERVRDAVRWQSVHPYNADQVVNMVLYRSTTDPGGGASGFLGMTRANVEVLYVAGTTLNPNDERIKVTIRNYRYSFFSPWVAGSFVDANPITESAPMFYKP